MGAGSTGHLARGVRTPEVRVRLLGGFDLRLDDVPVPPLDSGRAESLLAYLLLHRDAPQQRQRLAFLLWPDSSESQARTNLRHILYHLRRGLPEADWLIDARSRTLQWRAEIPLWLDVAAFEQALDEGRLADAIATYGGDLLAGSYDEWLLEERDRLAQRYVDALDRLVDELEAKGRRSEAIGCAERLVRHDPLREEAYQRLIRLYDAAGDRARALRAYHVCATTLQRELGTEPAAATRAAYEALLPGLPETQAVAGGSAARPPLIGRAVERRHLTTLWRASTQGRAQVALVTGEAGIGKSRLVEELRSWCAHSGAVTAEARAYAAEGAMAYGLVTTWLRAEPVASNLRRLDRSHLGVLARLLPELAAEVPDVAAVEPVPGTELRQRLFESVTRALLRPGPPLMLVADDLQWADAESLQLMHYLLRAQPDARLLIAATARREELDPHSPVNRFVAAVQVLGCLTEVGLERLDEEESAALAQRLTGRELDDDLATRLYAESEGNPLFIIEALRADTTGTLVPAAGSRVQAVITARLAQLSEPAAELAGVAATIGREFDTQLLAAASGTDEHTFVRGLDELWRRGLVRAHDPASYDFSHGKIRETAYAALSPAQAGRCHLRVARALEQRRHVDAASAQIASHYAAAGAKAEAIAWYERAAAAAQRLHASADAVRVLERALELVRALPEGADRAALELRLLTALPAPLVAVEGYLSNRVAEVHERALGLTAALGVEPEAPLLRSLALATLTRGEFEAARPFGEQLRARADREQDDVLWVESAYVLGVAAFWQGQLEAAQAQFEAALARFRPGHRAAHLLRYGQDPEVFCGLRLAYALWLLGRDDESRVARDRALAIAEASRHPFTRTSTTAWAALLALDQHDEEQLRRHVQTLAAGHGAQRATPVRLLTEALLGHVDVLDGRVGPGLRRSRDALEACTAGESSAPGLLAMHARILLESCTAAGNAEAGLATADEALVMGGGAQLWEAEIRRLRAQFLAALGAPPVTVDAELLRALAVAERQGARSIVLRVRKPHDQLRAGTP